jgi:hypothetical protein
VLRFYITSSPKKYTLLDIYYNDKNEPFLLTNVMLSTYFIIQIRAMITSKQYTQSNKKDQHDFILDQQNGCSHKATTTLDILGELGWAHLRSSLSLNILQQALKMIRNLPRETKIMALLAFTHACLGGMPQN